MNLLGWGVPERLEANMRALNCLFYPTTDLDEFVMTALQYGTKVRRSMDPYPDPQPLAAVVINADHREVRPAHFKDLSIRGYRGPLVALTERFNEAREIELLKQGAHAVFSFGGSRRDPDLGLYQTILALVRCNSDQGSSLSIGPFTVDLMYKYVSHDPTGDPVHLTRMQFRILEYLMLRRGSVCSKESIWHGVHGPWGANREPESLDAYICVIRRVFKNFGYNEPVILTVRGQGFRIPRVPERGHLRLVAG